MNNYFISLSSNSTNYTQVLPQIELDDHTVFTVSLSNLIETVLPLVLNIDWGFGDVLTYDNNIYKSGKTQSIINGHYSPLMAESYSFEYYPSSTSLYKVLSAQILVTYANNDNAWFIIPIKIRTYGYFESVEDLTLINTNILPIHNNLSEHQLKTLRNGYLIELRGD